MLPLGAHIRAALLAGLLLGPPLIAVPAAGAEAPRLAVDVFLYEFAIEPAGLDLTPGTNVTFRIVNTGAAPHNLTIEGIAKWDPALNNSQSASLDFTMPEEPTRIAYYCAVEGHRELGMVGNLTVKGARVEGVGAGGVAQVRALGVNFYAYWVGVISFVVLFLVIAATFFLLRYGESRHWTDQKDRPVKDKGEAPPKMTGTWVVLGIVLIVFLVAAVQIARVV